MKGFVNLLKPEGMSSAYAVGAVKKKLRISCGHMGTLDPMASGVLPVGLGKTSRLFDFLLNKEKSYETIITFGYLTDTLDKTGQTLKTTNTIPTIKDLENACKYFVGDISQIPPNYSAKCINGKRGYQLARSGFEFTLPPKIVHIDSFKCLGQISENDFKFKIDCRGGTYIRSLARDIALKCNSLGTMSELKRTKCGVFNFTNGIDVDLFFNSENPEKYILPPDNAVDFEKLFLTKTQSIELLNGLYKNYGFNNGTYRVYADNDFWGVGIVEEGLLKMKAYVR